VVVRSASQRAGLRVASLNQQPEPFAICQFDQAPACLGVIGRRHKTPVTGFQLGGGKLQFRQQRLLNPVPVNLVAETVEPGNATGL
jgi:hypothetical protein